MVNQQGLWNPTGLVTQVWTTSLQVLCASFREEPLGWRVTDYGDKDTIIMFLG